MNELADVEAATQRTQELLEQHEIWRQTTWLVTICYPIHELVQAYPIYHCRSFTFRAGFFVRQLQSMMRKLEPVIDQVVEPFSDTDTFAGALTMNLIRLVAIITMMLAFSVVAKIIQNVVGTELIGTFV
jgi:hypothetical protein